MTPYSCAPADAGLNSHAASRDEGGFLLTRVRGDVYVASWRRLSAAVALSSPRADTQIRSRNSLARCLMVHQHQVQCDTEAPVCAPSSQLWSTVSRPSVTKCCAVTPVLEHYPPSTSMILMKPQAFYCQSIIEQPLKEIFFFSTAI